MPPNKLLSPNSKLEKITLEILELQDYKPLLVKIVWSSVKFILGLIFWVK